MQNQLPLNADAVAKALRDLLKAITQQFPVDSGNGMVQVWLDSAHIKQGYQALGEPGNGPLPVAAPEPKPATPEKAKPEKAKPVTTKSKARELKLFNGRGYVCRKYGDPRWDACSSGNPPHCYVAAYSRADAQRVIEEYTGRKPSASELRDYWSNCWGNTMKGITPERGLWVAFDTKSPVKVTP